jgi:DNA polymerase theta
VEERDVVEACFKSGVVRVLVATSTLAAGVNLPARRVIFRQPKIGRDFIDGTRYRQMAGRAGRAGIDTKGESVCPCFVPMQNNFVAGCSAYDVGAKYLDEMCVKI